MCTAVTEDIFFLIMRELLEVNKECLLDAGWLAEHQYSTVSLFPTSRFRKIFKNAEVLNLT